MEPQMTLKLTAEPKKHSTKYVGDNHQVYIKNNFFKGDVPEQIYLDIFAADKDERLEGAIAFTQTKVCKAVHRYDSEHEDFVAIYVSKTLADRNEGLMPMRILVSVRK